MTEGWTIGEDKELEVNGGLSNDREVVKDGGKKVREDELLPVITGVSTEKGELLPPEMVVTDVLTGKGELLPLEKVVTGVSTGKGERRRMFSDSSSECFEIAILDGAVADNGETDKLDTRLTETLDAEATVLEGIAETLDTGETWETICWVSFVTRFSGTRRGEDMPVTIRNDWGWESECLGGGGLE